MYAGFCARFLACHQLKIKLALTIRKEYRIEGVFLDPLFQWLIDTLKLINVKTHALTSDF